MSDTCIVCLGDLGENANVPNLSSPPTPLSPHLGSSTIRRPSSPSHPNDFDSRLIAHLLPCGHDLHNGCLKPWVERANSCPICRQSFNTVELSAQVGGKLCLPSPSKIVDLTFIDQDPAHLPIRSAIGLKSLTSTRPCSLTNFTRNQKIDRVPYAEMTITRNYCYNVMPAMLSIIRIALVWTGYHSVTGSAIPVKLNVPLKA